jgi:hypothetical protein
MPFFKKTQDLEQTLKTLTNERLDPEFLTTVVHQACVADA